MTNYKYEETGIMDKFAILNLDNISFPDIDMKVEELDASSQKELFFDFYDKLYQYPRDRFERFYQWIESDEGPFSLPIIMREGKIIATTRVELQRETDRLYTFHIICGKNVDENECRKAILDYIAKKVKMNPKKIYLYLGGDAQEYAEIYEKLGIEFEVVKSYEMKL